MHYKSMVEEAKKQYKHYEVCRRCCHFKELGVWFKWKEGIGYMVGKNMSWYCVKCELEFEHMMKDEK